MKSVEMSNKSPAQLRRDITKIGNTPIQRLDFIFADDTPRPIFIKLEGCNPGGSIKDRTALSIINQAEVDGKIRPGTIMIDSSSGNAAFGYAWIARAKGYEFEAVVDVNTTAENVARIESLGYRTHIVKTPDTEGGYLASRIRFCEDVCRENPNYLWLNQYKASQNPTAHFHGTATEIVVELGSDIDAIFVAVSTGGTLSGIAQYMKVARLGTKIIAVDACGSIVLGGKPGKRLLTGIGASRRSDFIAPYLYDHAVLVNDAEAFAVCRKLRASTGLSVGGSSGAVLAACASLLPEHPEWRKVICLCPDDGDNYVSTIFNDEWLARNEIDVAREQMHGIEDFILSPYQSSKMSLRLATA